MNNGVYSQWCYLSYVSFEDALQFVRLLGRGAWLAKVDIRQAYRNDPTPTIMGYRWRVNRCSPPIRFTIGAKDFFTALADAAEWKAQQRAYRVLCITLMTLELRGQTSASKQYATCWTCLVIWACLLPRLSWKAPATTLSILGMEIDTVAMEIRLRQDKLVALQSLAGW